MSRWSSPVCATSTTSASGAASSAAMKPPGRGASTWVIASARRAIALQAELAQPVDAALPALGGEVAALGEDHERVVLVEAVGQRRRSGPRGRRRAGLGRDEAGRDPAEQHVDDRVPGQGVLEHDPRLAAVPVHQRVDQRERVARPGVPAGHQERDAGVGVRARAVGLDAAAAAPAGPRGRRPTSRPAPGRSGCPRSTACAPAARSPEENHSPSSTTSSSASQVR